MDTTMHNWTLAEAASALRSGSVTSEAYTASLIDRAKALSHLNVFITLDETGALEAARAADKAQAGGTILGPLHGIPIVVKDNIAAEGLPFTGATPGLRSIVAKTDAPTVARMRAAGAIILGKTNLHELAFGITSNNGGFGPVRNPHDPNRIPGGSSGGTAAAIAAGIVPAGLATDTGGSSRIPGALCGCAGLRPTTGRYPSEHVILLSYVADTVGPMARSAADLALLDGLLGADTTVAAQPDLRSARIGIPRSAFYEDIDADVARVADETIARLKEAGATLVDVDLSRVVEIDREISLPLVLFEARQIFEGYCPAALGISAAEFVPQIASPDVRGIFEMMLSENAIPQETYDRAKTVLLPELRASYDACFADNGLDAILQPTTPLPATPIGQDETLTLNGTERGVFPTFISHASPVAMGAIPGISLPAGLSAGGLPIGMELDGPRGTDRALLALAEAVEGVLPPPAQPAL